MLDGELKVTSFPETKIAWGKAQREAVWELFQNAPHPLHQNRRPSKKASMPGLQFSRSGRNAGAVIAAFQFTGNSVEQRNQRVPLEQWLSAEFGSWHVGSGRDWCGHHYTRYTVYPYGKGHIDISDERAREYLTRCILSRFAGKAQITYGEFYEAVQFFMRMKAVTLDAKDGELVGFYNDMTDEVRFEYCKQQAYVDRRAVIGIRQVDKGVWTITIGPMDTYRASDKGTLEITYTDTQAAFAFCKKMEKESRLRIGIGTRGRLSEMAQEIAEQVCGEAMEAIEAHMIDEMYAEGKIDDEN